MSLRALDDLHIRLKIALPEGVKVRLQQRPDVDYLLVTHGRLELAILNPPNKGFVLVALSAWRKDTAEEEFATEEALVERVLQCCNRKGVA